MGRKRMRHPEARVADGYEKPAKPFASTFHVTLYRQDGSRMNRNYRDLEEAREEARSMLNVDERLEKAWIRQVWG